MSKIFPEENLSYARITILNSNEFLSKYQSITSQNKIVFSLY